MHCVSKMEWLNWLNYCTELYCRYFELFFCFCHTNSCHTSLNIELQTACLSNPSTFYYRILLSYQAFGTSHVSFSHFHKIFIVWYFHNLRIFSPYLKCIITRVRIIFRHSKKSIKTQISAFVVCAIHHYSSLIHRKQNHVYERTHSC